MAYYAVTNVNGPISVRLEGDTPAEAIAYAERAEYGRAPGEDDGLGRSWIDSARTDLEDEFAVDGSGMNAAEFSRALRGMGARHVRAFGDGWDLWIVEQAAP
ncbi:MAG TPA: hypothetical protein VKY73_00505 [Polyangiaceae bacterium]|nr:hypothetical protein [Polyangiaceae bacterium]